MGGTVRGYGRARTVAMKDPSTLRQRPVNDLRIRAGSSGACRDDTGPARLRCSPVTHAPLAGLQVTHFGHFDPTYSRNRIVAKALRRAGAEVRVVTDPRPYARRTPALVRHALAAPTDLFVVGFPGHADVPTAKALARLRGAPVLFDAFVSLQETVEDRGRMPPGALGRHRLELEDRLSCRWADRVLVDTNAHGEHFATEPRCAAGEAAAPVGRRRRRRDATSPGGGARRLPDPRVRELHPVARARTRRAGGGDPRADGMSP